MSLHLHPGFIPVDTNPQCHSTFIQALSQSLQIPEVTLPSPRLYLNRYQSLISLYLHSGFISVVANP